eukprot:269287-Rhodomonas_salina.1
MYPGYPGTEAIPRSVTPGTRAHRFPRATSRGKALGVVKERVDSHKIRACEVFGHENPIGHGNPF